MLVQVNGFKCHKTHLDGLEEVVPDPLGYRDAETFDVCYRYSPLRKKLLHHQFFVSAQGSLLSKRLHTMDRVIQRLVDSDFFFDSKAFHMTARYTWP